MKTSIKALIAIVLTSFTLTAAASNKLTVLNEIKEVNKINVSGNVELILVQSNAESVQVYNDYYSSNALVQSKNGSLNISSFEKEKLTVVVNVKNVTNITATDDVTISSFGKLSFLSLDLKLKDNAKADLNLLTVNLTSQVKGNAALSLEGMSLNHTANVQNLANVNLTKFDSEKTSFQSSNIKIAQNGGLEEVNTIQLGK